MTDSLIEEHLQFARRFFLKSSALACLCWHSTAFPQQRDTKPDEPSKKTKPDKAGVLPDPYFTPSHHFRDVSRGKPLPHTLAENQKSAVGMTRESWRLQILPDPDHPTKMDRIMSIEQGTDLNFEALMKLAETKAVRFPKVMTCLNLGCPLGMGLWEGVPLRDVIWMTKPRENLRRVFYYGYHNDAPDQIFQSSLPVGRVLEDPPDVPPVILCYKLNGQWLDSERGGPVRMLVPEAYGFKSIKWLSHIFLTNLAHANDTYAQQNNDVDSPMKTFAAALVVPREVKANEPIPVSGYAQVGISGLKKIQVSLELDENRVGENDPYFLSAPWVDAEILAAPSAWSELPLGQIPKNTFGFDDFGKPHQWPMRFCNAHWARTLPGMPAGKYVFRSRSIDNHGAAQPMPRPFRKSGHAAIESIDITVV